MPLYSYICPDKHVTDKQRKMTDRKEPAMCSTCGLEATFIITVSKVKPTFGNGDTQWNMREKHRRNA